jgi:hypothetical protein
MTDVTIYAARADDSQEGWVLTIGTEDHDTHVVARLPVDITFVEVLNAYRRLSRALERLLKPSGSDDVTW